MIQRSEIHIVHSPEDAELAADGGLIEIVDEQPCANCGSSVGCVEGKFIPVAITLNEEAEWLLCLACIFPAVKPRS